LDPDRVHRFGIIGRRPGQVKSQTHGLGHLRAAFPRVRRARGGPVRGGRGPPGPKVLSHNTEKQHKMLSQQKNNSPGLGKNPSPVAREPWNHIRGNQLSVFTRETTELAPRLPSEQRCQQGMSLQSRIHADSPLVRARGEGSPGHRFGETKARRRRSRGQPHRTSRFGCACSFGSRAAPGRPDGNGVSGFRGAGELPQHPARDAWNPLARSRVVWARGHPLEPGLRTAKNARIETGRLLARGAPRFLWPSSWLGAGASRAGIDGVTGARRRPRGRQEGHPRASWLGLVASSLGRRSQPLVQPLAAAPGQRRQGRLVFLR
jgi:hypothetical protein